MGAVVALVVAVVVIALINVASGTSASPPAGVSAPGASAAGAGANGAGANGAGADGANANGGTAATVPPGRSSTQLATWPVGLPGWTAVLASSRSEASAKATARRIAAAGISVGVLNSSRHPALAPRYWVVFSGRYANRAAAQSHAHALVANGYAEAHARLVGRPGG
ncbi:MAG: SPOR domain-containing protein [Solirubrobacteraceae bacterium]